MVSNLKNEVIWNKNWIWKRSHSANVDQRSYLFCLFWRSFPKMKSWPRSFCVNHKKRLKSYTHHWFSQGHRHLAENPESSCSKRQLHQQILCFCLQSSLDVFTRQRAAFGQFLVVEGEEHSDRLGQVAVRELLWSG